MVKYSFAIHPKSCYSQDGEKVEESERQKRNTCFELGSDMIPLIRLMLADNRNVHYLGYNQTLDPLRMALHLWRIFTLPVLDPRHSKHLPNCDNVTCQRSEQGKGKTRERQLKGKKKRAILGVKRTRQGLSTYRLKSKATKVELLFTVSHCLWVFFLLLFDTSVM